MKAYHIKEKICQKGKYEKDNGRFIDIGTCACFLNRNRNERFIIAAVNVVY